MRRILLAVALILLFCSKAHSTLIGDTIFIEHRFPHVNSNILPTDSGFGAFRTIEQAEIDEGKSWFHSSPHSLSKYFVDFEDKRILVNYQVSTSWGATGPNPITFNGLFIEGIDNELLNVTVDTNNLTWSDTRLFFGNGEIHMDWKGMGTIASDHYFYINLEFEQNQGNVIPEPATMFLFGSGMAGVFLRRKKKV